MVVIEPLPAAGEALICINTSNPTVRGSLRNEQRVVHVVIIPNFLAVDSDLGAGCKIILQDPWADVCSVLWLIRCDATANLLLYVACVCTRTAIIAISPQVANIVFRPRPSVVAIPVIWCVWAGVLARARRVYLPRWWWRQR